MSRKYTQGDIVQKELPSMADFKAGEYYNAIRPSLTKSDAMEPTKVETIAQGEDVNFINFNKVIFKQLPQYKKPSLPPLDNSTTLIGGVTGCGKDFMMKLILEQKLFKKVLFIGCDGDFDGPFAYLQELDFYKNNNHIEVDFSKNFIFIPSGPWGEGSLTSKEIKEIALSAFAEDYMVILNGTHKLNQEIKEAIAHARSSDAKLIIMTQEIDAFFPVMEHIQALIVMKTAGVKTNEAFTKSGFPSNSLYNLASGEYVYLVSR